MHDCNSPAIVHREPPGPQEKGEANMDGKIVVSLGMPEDLADVLSCFEFLTRPGMTAIFLLRYPLEVWPYIRDHWVTTESVTAANARGRENLEKYSQELQQELADRKLAPVREALRQKGIAVKIVFYTGSLRKALRKYSADPEVFWIVRPASRPRLLTPLLGMISARFRSLRAAKLIPSWSRFRVACRRDTREQTS
jgi:hypothetical protein